MSLLRFFRLTARSKRAYAVYLENAPDGTFSTDQIDTGQKWITGATIYRKVVPIAAGPNNSSVVVSLGIAGAIFKIIRADVAIRINDNSRITVFSVGGGLLAATLATSIVCIMDGANLTMTSGVGGNYSNYSGHLILEYTLSAS